MRVSSAEINREAERKGEILVLRTHLHSFVAIPLRILRSDLLDTKWFRGRVQKQLDTARAREKESCRRS